MKTKNIFRLLFMAGALVVGINCVKATERTIWPTAQASAFTIPYTEFQDVAEDYVIRVYASVTDDNNWGIKFKISSLNSGPQFKETNLLNWGAEWVYQGTALEDGCFTVTCSSTSAEHLAKSGLTVTPWGITVSHVTIDDGLNGNTPLVITIDNDIENGSVSTTVEEANKGDEVTVSATALAGYKLKHFLINEDVLLPLDNGIKQANGTTTYTGRFIMPAKAVTVSAEFIDENIIWQGSEGTLEIDGSIIGSVSADAILRVWAPKEVFFIGAGYSALFYSQNQNVILSSDFDSYYNDNGAYFEFTLTKEILERFTSEVPLRLQSSYGNSKITQVMLISGSSSPDIPTHTLTLIIDGQTQTKTVAEGTVLANVLPTPTKEGYTFTGWSGIPESGNMPTNDLTVTAQFSINSYKLTYKVDGEVYGDVETIEYGAAINPRTAPTKDGFSFSGWNGLPETMPAHDVEVTGEFTGIKYKVEIASTTYGVITTDKEAYEKGETVTVTIKDNIGYEMESISTDPTNLGLQRVDDGVFSFVMPDADVMVTVRFKAKEYTLTFMLNNEVYEVGEIPQIYQVRYGTSITLPADPAQEEGYTFSGWSGIPADGKMPAGDLTVYGHFNAMLSVGSIGYATYCPTKPVIFEGNEDIKAYIAKEKSDTEVTLIQVIGAVAAGTGLVLIGEAGAEVEFEVTNEGTDYSNENLMIGVTGASANIHASNLYVLVQKEDGVKFADTAANAATVPVGKAYLQAPVNSSRILTICFGDESTGMETVHASTNKKVEVYNLSGQRIANPRKGLYIVNGKKAFIK